MAKNENRSFVKMKCTVCGTELRPTSKNKKNNPERLEVKKYCPKCRKSVAVKEAKQFKKGVNSNEY